MSLKLDTGVGDERPRPQHGIDGSGLLHGLYITRQVSRNIELKICGTHTTAGKSWVKKGARLGKRSFDEVEVVLRSNLSARDHDASPDSVSTTTT